MGSGQGLKAIFKIKAVKRQLLLEKPICIASRTKLLIQFTTAWFAKTAERLGLQTASVWNDILPSIRRVLESWNDWCIAAKQMHKDSRIPAVSTRCNKKSSGMPLLSFGAVFSVKPYNARTMKKCRFQLICLNVCRCLWSDCFYNILSTFGVENHAQTSGQGIQQGNGLRSCSRRGLIWVGNSLGPKESWMLHLNFMTMLQIITWWNSQ